MVTPTRSGTDQRRRRKPFSFFISPPSPDPARPRARARPRIRAPALCPPPGAPPLAPLALSGRVAHGKRSFPEITCYSPPPLPGSPAATQRNKGVCASRMGSQRWCSWVVGTRATTTVRCDGCRILVMGTVTAEPCLRVCVICARRTLHTYYRGLRSLTELNVHMTYDPAV